MENPWKDISWEQPYALCDKDIILSEKYKERLQIDGALPEPYIGDLKSKVVCLNGNPGSRDNKFANRDLFFRELLATLTHNSNRFMWLSEEIEETKHDGIGWWKLITKSLCDELCNIPQLFVLEFFPYHSVQTFNFPELPSDAYRNYLLEKAMDANKLIVIMRSKSRWYRIRENGIGERLKNYKNKIILSNPQRVYLTKNNMKKEGDWELFLHTLKQQE